MQIKVMADECPGENVIGRFYFKDDNPFRASRNGNKNSEL